MWFLARWAKCLSWQEVARVFRTSWDQVFRSVAMAVAWGRDHVDLTGIRAIGIDEIHWQRGSQFLTLVYQIETSPVGVVVFEARTGALVSLNREAARIVQDLCGPGQSAEQLLGVITCRRADGREIALDRLPLARALDRAETVRAEEVVLPSSHSSAGLRTDGVSDDHCL